jgi:hypothetical protein
MAAATSRHAVAPPVLAIMVLFVLAIAILAIWYGRTR